MHYRLTASTLLMLLPCREALSQAATALDRFEPAPVGDTFVATSSPNVEGERLLSVGATLSFAYAPLSALNAGTREALIEQQWLLHNTASFEIAERLKVDVDAPVLLEQNGDSSAERLPSPTGPAMGDVRLGARLQGLKGHDAVPSSALSLRLWLPTGDSEAYTSTGTIRLEPALILGADYGDFVWSASLGRRFVFEPEAVEQAGLFTHETTFSAALGPRVGPLMLAAELIGAVPTPTPGTTFEGDAVNLEALLSATLQLGPIRLRLGAAPGLTHAPGTPAVRVLGGFSYAVESAPERPAPSRAAVGAASPSVDTSEATTTPPQFSPPQSSPPSLIPRAPTSAPPSPISAGESASNPELDTDADGVPDAQDACPSALGPASFERKINGCPLDRDGDGISDSQDACPEDAGPVATDPSANGCRTTALVIGEQIVIRDKIVFESGKAVIVPSSEAVLEGLASVLASHHEIARLAIEGHTDDLGPEQLNLALSQARAAAVMRWLIEHGVDERRLQASGYGSRRPLKPNSSPAEREANRRVDFQIVRRSALGKDGWTMGPLE